MSKIPSKSEILDWIEQNPTLTAKRDIAKAFGIKGAARIDLKRVLKELEAEGHLEKRQRSYQDPDRLPPVSVLLVTGPDKDGDLFAKPMEWHGQGAEPVVLLIPRDSDPALGEGDRILARLTLVKGEEHHYEARLIRRIGSNPKKVLGIFRKAAEGGRIVPIDKGADREWRVGADHTHGAKDGELVEAEQAGPKASIITLTMDKNGVPQDVDTRVAIAAEIVQKAMEKGFGTERIFIDAIVLPVKVPNAQAQPGNILAAMDQIRYLADPAPHMTVGLSNVSQGARERSLINRIFLAMAASHGLDSAIVDVLDEKLMNVVATAEMLRNKQIYSDSFLKVHGN
ncbi:hypothetical protein LCGC14_2168570 [marine sediment metagenome]|uniref:Pterin-binding domain-containing protein n=1 Tax=marine sediment metagenome TaxID=412755 RepID=A0A0F9DQK0_9ZZZZ